MTAFLTPSKFIPPHLPNLVHRHRLFNRLMENRDKPFVFIIGQAAQGKSSLVSDYFHQTGASAAWLHLDETDRECPNFCDLFVRAVNRATPKNDLSPFLTGARTVFGSGPDIPRHLEFMGALLAHVPCVDHIVLDGLEHLMPDSPSYNLIGKILTILSPKTRLFILSRQMPSYKVQQLKIARKALVIDNQDLAFTGPEIRAFFKTVYNRCLTDPQTEYVLDMTDGWPGGLVILGESLALGAKDGPFFELSKHLSESVKKEALDFFSEDIFSSQTKAVQSFLIRSSVMDVMEPDLLAELLDLDDPQSLLETLLNRNLFIRSFHEKTPKKAFTYHPLFRTFLLEKFKSILPEHQQKRILIKLGRLYGQRRQNEKAVAVFLEMGEYEKAGVAIQKVGMDLYIRGRFNDLTRWISALPEKMAQNDPWLGLYAVLADRFKNGMRNIDRLRRILAAFTAKQDIRGQLLGLAGLIEAGIFLGHDRKEVNAWIQQGDNLLESLGGSPLYVYAKTVLWQQIGLGRITGGCFLSRGIAACKNAHVLAEIINNPQLRINAMVSAALGYMMSGEFAQVEKALQKISPFTRQSLNPEYRTLQNIVRMELALYQGDLDSAGEREKAIEKDIEVFGLLFLYPAFIDISAHLKLHTHDFAGAKRDAEQLAHAATLASNPHYKGLSHRLFAKIQYGRRRFNEAEAMCKKAVSAFTKHGEPGLHLNRARILLGLILSHSGQMEAARQNLNSALAFFRSHVNPMAMAETRLALALLEKAVDNKDGARAHMVRGFEIVAEKNYTRFMLLSPWDLMEIGTLAVELDLEPAASQAAALLATCLEDAPARLREKMESAKSTREKMAWNAVNRKIFLLTRPRLEMMTLGRFSVLIDGEKPIGDKSWGGDRPKLMLKSIIAHNAKNIPKDVIIEDLWPEADAKTGANNFKVTLHRLRRVLEPDMDRHFGSSYVHLKDNLVSLDPGLCQWDADVFSALFHRIIHQDRPSDPENLMALCHRARDIYTGDFLSEDPYLSWASGPRNTLKAQYVAILTRLAETWEKLGRSDRAIELGRAVIEAEPLSEKANQWLIRLLADQGMISEAACVYESYCRLLKSEMGLPPDEKTRRLYDTLLAKNLA